ncbi:TPA: hypothetical protein ENX78_03595 [Candidatus Poribacteria bacterium]|nr:hypothetical protein [Candidatus Poribacteria bacterium]
MFRNIITINYKLQYSVPVLIFFSIVLFSGCGDVEPVTTPPPPEVAEISNVLKNRWKLGYETESLDLYMSAFWKEGYFYWSDMATDDRIDDDVIFDNWEEERDSAIRVFKNYRNIEIEISEPPEVKILNEERTKAEVRNHYKIQLYVPEGTSLPGGYEAYYAEGDNIFIFEYRANENGKMEWRITEWRQNEYSKEEIEAGWKQ